MNAKVNDFARIQEIYDVVTETQRQIRILNITKQQFINPKNDADDLIPEGILNRVLRVTEEAGCISDKVSKEYNFDRHAVRGVRNRLAHAYGEVDREIIWNVIQYDFDELLQSCKRFCEDMGIDLK